MRYFIAYCHAQFRFALRPFFLFILVLLACATEALADLPTITTNLPTLRAAATNTTVTFSISATQSNPPSPAVLSFQWRRNGVNLSGTLRSFTNTSVTTTYSISNIIASDGGAYSVVVFNDHGAISSAVTELVVTNTPVVSGSDNFAGRDTFALSDEVTIRANNSTATAESGEPKHGNVTASRSLWFTWSLSQLSAGVWTIDTIGSTIDTTLSVYSDPGSGATNVSALASSGQLSFENDEANVPDHFHNSAVKFTAAAGRTYAIAVDGFYGAKGYVVLNIRRQSSGAVIGIITQPHTQTAASNSTVILSATLDKAYFSYQWFKNGIAVTGTNLNPNDATNIFLTNFNFSAASVGQYQAKVILGGNILLTDPASLQLNMEDGGYNPNANATPKFRQSSDSAYTPLVIRPRVVAVSGFSGTHIWNTYGAAAEPGEPNHCGKAGGAPYWFSYLANATGTLTVDANTASYTNVLAVYTWTGGDFSQLNSVACVSTNLGVGRQVTTFSAANGTTYYVVVDGLNGATGNCTLTYNLVSPPTFTLHPQSQTVPLGINVTLTAAASGIPAPTYQWRTNFVKYSNQTNNSTTVTNFQIGKEGSYDIVASNSIGMATSTVAKLYLNTPLRFTNVALTSTGFYAALLGKATTNYIIQANTNLATTNWLNIRTNSSPYGIISFVDTNYASYSNRFFRAK